VKIGVQNNAVSEANRSFLVCTGNFDILGALVANDVKKISNEFDWGKDGSFGAIAPVPFPGYVTGSIKVYISVPVNKLHCELTEFLKVQNNEKFNRSSTNH